MYDVERLNVLDLSDLEEGALFKHVSSWGRGFRGFLPPVHFHLCGL